MAKQQIELKCQQLHQCIIMYIDHIVILLSHASNILLFYLFVQLAKSIFLNTQIYIQKRF